MLHARHNVSIRCQHQRKNEIHKLYIWLFYLGNLLIGLGLGLGLRLGLGLGSNVVKQISGHNWLLNNAVDMFIEIRFTINTHTKDNYFLVFIFASYITVRII